MSRSKKFEKNCRAICSFISWRTAWGSASLFCRKIFRASSLVIAQHGKAVIKGVEGIHRILQKGGVLGLQGEKILGAFLQAAAGKYAVFDILNLPQTVAVFSLQGARCFFFCLLDALQGAARHRQNIFFKRGVCLRGVCFFFVKSLFYFFFRTLIPELHVRLLREPFAKNFMFVFEERFERKICFACQSRDGMVCGEGKITGLQNGERKAAF